MNVFENLIKILEETRDSIKWAPCRRCGKQVREDTADNCSECQSADERQERLRKLEQRAGLPVRFRWAKSDHPLLAELTSKVEGGGSTKATKRLVRNILRAPEPFVLLCGNKGTGKTSLACAVLREWLSRGLFVNALTLAAADTQHRLGDGEAPLVARALSAELLVLDELVDVAIASRRQLLERVLWWRYDHELKTIVTTGLEDGALVSAYGTGFQRRVLDESLRINLGTGLVERRASRLELEPSVLGDWGVL